MRLFTKKKYEIIDKYFTGEPRLDNGRIFYPVYVQSLLRKSRADNKEVVFEYPSSVEKLYDFYKMREEAEKAVKQLNTEPV